MNHLAILENDVEFSRNLLNDIIWNNNKVRLVRLAAKADELEDKLEKLEKGDILIFDLDIPDVKRLELIDKLKQSERPLPYIIAYSKEIERYQAMPQYKACFHRCLQKPFAIKKIVEMVNQITYETSIHYYEKQVKQELHKFEMNIITKGYAYIVEAITLSLENENLLTDMTHGLYKIIAARHGVTVDNIKWSIEKSMKSVIRYTDCKLMNSYFYVVSGEKITPKMFITTIVENLRDKIDEEEYA